MKVSKMALRVCVVFFFLTRDIRFRLVIWFLVFRVNFLVRVVFLKDRGRVVVVLFIEELILEVLVVFTVDFNWMGSLEKFFWKLFLLFMFFWVCSLLVFFFKFIVFSFSLVICRLFDEGNLVELRMVLWFGSLSIIE